VISSPGIRIINNTICGSQERGDLGLLFFNDHPATSGAVVQNNIISGALKGGDRPLKVPLIVRLITALPWLQGIPARFLALGVRPEHVHSKAVSPS